MSLAWCEVALALLSVYPVFIDESRGTQSGTPLLEFRLQRSTISTIR